MPDLPIYMLRRCFPLWKTEAAIQEAVAFCRRNRIGEVIWKIDPEDFNHGFTPEPLQRQYVTALRRAREILTENGIVFSLNPWLTLNHIDRNRYPGDPPEGFSWRMMADGTVAREMACPLSPGWRAWLLKGYELYAGLHPSRLWIEDDFKTYTLTSGEIGCFCPRHLKAFGWTGSRQELARALQDDAALRRRWFDFNGDIMLAVAKELEATVHRISPETRLGLMGSWSSDGRWWKDAAQRVAGPHRPLVRTSLAPYTEVPPWNVLPDGPDLCKETACYPRGTDNCPELENSPYGIFNKSASTTRLQILTAFVHGNRSITMNLYDMLGTPIAADDRYGRMLRRLHPFLAGWNRLTAGGGTPVGVNLPFRPDFADFALDKDGHAFFDGDRFAPLLLGAGIPVAMNQPEAVCTALTGNHAAMLSAEEIRRIFSGAVFVDGRAAATLTAKGFGELLGLRAHFCRDFHARQLSAELDEAILGANPDGSPRYLTLSFITRLGASYYDLEPLPAGRTAAVLVDNEHRPVGSAWILCENHLGGRVATCAYDLTCGVLPNFMSEARATQFRALHHWLTRGHSDGLVIEGGGWKLPFQRDFGGYSVIGLLQFDLDPLEVFTFALPVPPGKTLRFRQLGPDGRLHPVTPQRSIRRTGRLIVTFRQTLHYGDAAVFKVQQTPGPWHGIARMKP